MQEKIEVLRNGKITKAKNINSADIIAKPQYEQLQVFDMNKYRNLTKEII